ncbi:MAG TPA: 50S ribosomal protein L25 [Candidatus Hydrogenedentes bacterium]|nr:50S ribosomal protein L25 [Candidatus Hydrogenedentota bacterium]HIJ73683.1 50S ribosomal protein L25 [Candidatus Hydrogenedentota bacterium]
MDLQTLKVAARTDLGKGGARRTRRNGKVPIVLYGLGAAPVSLKAEERDFLHLVHGRAGEHAVVQLEVEGSPDLNCPALLKDVLHHPVRGDILHADFLRIRLDQRISTQVAVTLVGHSRGVVEGGVLDHQLREVEVECLATDVPAEITVDVTELDLGESLHVAQLAAPENVTIVTDPERTIVAVHVPRVVKTAAEIAAEEAEAAEAEAGEAAAEGTADAEGEA